MQRPLSSSCYGVPMPLAMSKKLVIAEAYDSYLLIAMGGFHG